MVIAVGEDPVSAACGMAPRHNLTTSCPILPTLFIPEAAPRRNRAGEALLRPGGTESQNFFASIGKPSLRFPKRRWISGSMV